MEDKEFRKKFSQYVLVCNEDRLKILIALFNSDVFKWGPEFEKEKND